MNLTRYANVRLEEGDLVQVKSWKEMRPIAEEQYDGDLLFKPSRISFTASMEHLCGARFNITGIEQKHNYIDIYGHGTCWTIIPDMISRVWEGEL